LEQIDFNIKEMTRMINFTDDFFPEPTEEMYEEARALIARLEVIEENKEIAEAARDGVVYARDNRTGQRYKIRKVETGRTL